MSQRPEDCVHSTTTTLLWLYGEADEAHAVHVSACAQCTAVAEEHALVVGVAGPSVSKLTVADPVRVEPLPAPANRSWWVGVGLGLAVAAAVLITFFATVDLSEPDVPEAPSIAHLERELPAAPQVALQDDHDDLDGLFTIDDDFDDLFDDFAAFEADLATL